MEETKVFLKTKDDGLWEKNPHLAFALLMIPYIIIFFGSIFLFVFNNVPGIILALWLILLTIGLVGGALYFNETRNISKSIGFVKKDGILYFIKLGYAKTVNGNMIYAPSGTVLQAATLKNNIDVAKQVQAAEHEVRNRRQNPEAYVSVVESMLKNSKEQSELPAGAIEFIILSNPKIEKKTNNFLWISYEILGERKIKKVRNAYDGLEDELKN